MVTTIILLFCFSLAFIAGGFVAFKGVQLGLRWQIETKKEQKPTLEVNPIKPIIEAKQQKEQKTQEEESASIFKEWLFGEEKR